MSRIAGAPLLVASLVLAACGAAQSPSPSPSPSSGASEPTATASQAPETVEPTAADTASAFAGAWTDATDDAMSSAGLWTNKVELADLDLDGDVDILFANGGDYDAPGTPVASSAWLNNGDGTFEEATLEILGEHELLTRVIKVGDLNGDELPDILMGTTYDTQSRLLLSTGVATWTDATATSLPVDDLSIGDLELGDVDADEDLDIVIADWGDDGPINDRGGRTRLYLNDGTGTFSDATEDMPDTLVGFSWDLELVDVDNDWDLDIAVSCKLCPSSLLFVNDGTGVFADETAERLPPTSNNYEFAPIDLDGDGYLDLVTINDGPQSATGFTEHVLRNDGTGRYVNANADWWPSDANLGWDDNVVVGLDVESDGDVDFLIGSLDGPDRLLVNDGTGVLSVVTDAFDASPSSGTLMMAVADLNGDGRLDVVEAQGEVAEDERVYLATEVLPTDTAAPVITVHRDGAYVLARVHDNRTPHATHDWQAVTATWDGGQRTMTWYGEHLFRAFVTAEAGAATVCATDAAGNEACAEG